MVFELAVLLALFAANSEAPAPCFAEILTGVRAEADDGTAKLLAEILSSDPNN